MIEKYYTHTLSNEIRIIFQPVDSYISHAALYINTGSRDEEVNEHGMAHLIEHVIFKGTEKRKAHQILSRMENVGGEINAYTTKEETCIHSSFMNEYLNRTLDLISDIIFHSTFPEKELEKEKSVIIDEINSYLDNPSDLIFDDFDQRIFSGSSLGRNILGKPEVLKFYSREDIKKFIDNKYNTDQMVLSIVGNYRFERVINSAKKFFEFYPLKKRNFERTKPAKIEPFKVKINKGLSQINCLIGTQAYGYKDEKRIPLLLLNDMLGGPGMNSRLSMTLREKHGYAYDIESSYVCFCDTGIFSIYLGCDKSRLNKCLELISKELDKLRNKKLSSYQMHLAKRQLLGQLAINMDNNESVMLSMGKSYLVYDCFDTLKEIRAKLDNVSAEDMLNVANEIFIPQELSILIYE
jgi:predicted Zn-dependent peptidase